MNLGYILFHYTVYKDPEKSYKQFKSLSHTVEKYSQNLLDRADNPIRKGIIAIIIFFRWSLLVIAGEKIALSRVVQWSRPNFGKANLNSTYKFLMVIIYKEFSWKYWMHML
ncbi:hypothetical protein PHYBLDRAFT_170359 [Phycomyces blakesleeanus NRRL 1555(-)]|uniref:Uncharacterized protein n=1 Tax=Phycomyces blakesleeanus (strain ATCC 8743b / DSM 1359 / FGSC 10004 / NBRC 33097 / NRRL 1555) TaxID=763407 RepID=A0A167M3S9_PHYB8|nr:hypothetical protein PHYBLDRAFT_170359 [Phycomyces blakesleeanus NRRL 1555(-)]OAD71699.1 hypothetical protein PHYBLDRAFT_170359 [Phycomyces blakesleeanus NRRL 1555(-)]|eukprot:XP_018289739.1 hypothetical protein PHYBLDRAFT_170359 [Phycomyces blakesleeanus NRRL 1555(-)]